MPTFLPYPDFKESFKALDYRRLGKQRVEAYQIYRAIKYESGWRHHPVTNLWRKHINALILYHNLCIDEWARRGYQNRMKKMKISGRISYPPWLGEENFHAAHRSNCCVKTLLFTADIAGWNRRICLMSGYIIPYPSSIKWP